MPLDRLHFRAKAWPAAKSEALWQGHGQDRARFTLGSPAHVPQLADEQSPLARHRLHHWLPPLQLLHAVDAGGVGVACHWGGGQRLERGGCS